MAEEKPLFVNCSSGLAAARTAAAERRFGNWQVRFQGLDIFCHDLLSFYMAAKDIFLHRIYDFTSSSPCPRVIDGGGHIGLFTLFVKQRYPKASVTIFEPEALSLGLLRKNLDRNRILDAEIIEAGLYKEEGTLRFGSDSSDGSSIFAEEKDSSIQVTRLSRYLQGEIDFLKLNIEGAELEVITEIEPKLHLVREMVIEYHGFPETGQNLHRILAILDRNGFRYLIHDFDAETNGASKPPFHLGEESRFFLLIYAKRLHGANVEKPAADPDFRLQPVSRLFGFDRGTPIDRYYIEKFLDAHRSLIRGSVLEIGDASYTGKYGTGVVKSEVLSAVPGQGVTLVGDLATGENIPESAYDCIILTQTIQMIYDVKSALRNAVRALRPGGSLLLTASGISQISRYDMDRWGEYWRFTDRSLAMLLQEAAPGNEADVRSYGNVGVAKAFLDGLALQEVPAAVLDHRDDDYQLLLAARLTKAPEKRPGLRNAGHASQSPPTVLLYHRVADDPLDSQILAVSPDHFEQQLAVLADTCRVVPLRLLLHEAIRNRAPEGSVAITIDDGYRDNLINALPLLEKYRMHATVFITSGMIGSDSEFWWDALENVFLTGRRLPESIAIAVNDESRNWPLGSPADRARAYDQICALLRSLPPREVGQATADLLRWAGADPVGRSTHLPLNREELKRLAASPCIEIGSHTVTHCRFTALAPEAQREELAASKRSLEEIIGKTVDIVSYPFGAAGDFSRETMRLTAEAGYRFGIANIQNDLCAPPDPFAVPRRLVRNWSGPEFAAWLASPGKEQFEAAAMSRRNIRISGGVHA